MHRLLKSFRHALAGINYALREERNFLIELAVTGAVFFFAWYFPLSVSERAIVIIACGAVLSLELINTAVERLLDMLKPRVHPYVKVIKDLVAGVVLITAIASALAGLIIFLPYAF